MTSGLIFDIKKYAIHDGPGIRTTVFLKGCPLQCGWCHNPEGLSEAAQRLYIADRCIGCGLCIDACPQQALTRGPNGIVVDPDRCGSCYDCAETCPSEATQKVGRPVGVEEVLETIEQDRLFYDQSGGGVTFSGGEPLAQAAFLLELLKACGRRGFHRAVDTSGCADAGQLMAVADQTDLFLYDLKLMDSDRHRKYTGIPNEGILSNLELLARRGATVIVRIPVIPGVNTDDDNAVQTARFLTALPGIRRVHLLPYHNTARKKYRQLGMDYISADISAPVPEGLDAVATALRAHGLEVRSGG